MSKFSIRMAVAKAARHPGRSFRIGAYKVRQMPYGLAVMVNGSHVVYRDSEMAINDMANRNGRLRHALRSR